MADEKKEIVVGGQRIPEWLVPFLKENAYNPGKDFLMNLVPQSRLEAILKNMALSSDETHNYFIEAGGNYFVDADGNKFCVAS